MKEFRSSIAVKKGMRTLFLLFIYVLGSRLALPFVDLNSRDFLGGSAAYLDFSVALTGGNLRSLSLFSIGLSPWMSAMILWQMFSFSKKLGLNSVSSEVPYNPFLVFLLNTSLLVAGTFFLVWLSDINASIGVGGPIVILLASMVASLPQDIIQSVQVHKISPRLLFLLVVLGVLFTYLVVLFFRARYRIPINKIGLHSRFKRYSYLEIMLNPAGGMPYMYVMSLMGLPSYLLILLQHLDKGNPLYPAILEQYAMGKPLWIYAYILILFVFSIAFAFINVSGQQIADRMKESGDYIYGVYPGEDTSRFINRLVLRFALIGAVFNVTLAGLPILFVLKDESLLKVSMIPGLFLILSGMLFTIHDELQALRLNERYRPLF